MSRRTASAASTGTVARCRSRFWLSNPGESRCEVDSPTTQRCAIATSGELAHPHIEGLGRRLYGLYGLGWYRHGELDLLRSGSRGGVVGSGIVGTTNNLFEGLGWLLSGCGLSWRLYLGRFLICSGTGGNGTFAVGLWRYPLAQVTATANPHEPGLRPLGALTIGLRPLLCGWWRGLVLLVGSFGVGTAPATSDRATPPSWEFAAEGPEIISFRSRIAIGGYVQWLVTMVICSATTAAATATPSPSSRSTFGTIMHQPLSLWVHIWTIRAFRLSLTPRIAGGGLCIVSVTTSTSRPFCCVTLWRSRGSPTTGRAAVRIP